MTTTEEAAANGQPVQPSEAADLTVTPVVASRPAAKPTRRKTASRAKPKPKTKAARSVKLPAKTSGPVAKFPRHALERALRIPKMILDQNAGHDCSLAEAARFFGGKASGEFQVEVSSAKKYGLLTALPGGRLALTERAKRVLRPQSNTDEIDALREAILDAPDFSDVYSHYRGEYLPDEKFFTNTLTERFKIPEDKISDFRDVFIESLRTAKLVEELDGRIKLIDVGREGAQPQPAFKDAGRPALPSSSHATTTDSGDTCFIMQPFADPYGGYYESIFRPALEQAGIAPVRADNEIFGAGGKIVDQVWRGIRQARVLLAELTTRNANVYYELGLAHALGKPVVLIAAKSEAVPFDVQHIRVIYYDVNDPFWGSKLIDKISENIRSALTNPEEAVLRIQD